MDTHLEVTELDPGSYEVKAVQGQVVTRHTIEADPGFGDRSGAGAVPGTTLVREVVEILLEHEALTAVPAQARIEQLMANYPYLASEHEQRLPTGSGRFPPSEAPLIHHLPAEDRPTHT